MAREKDGERSNSGGDITAGQAGGELGLQRGGAKLVPMGIAGSVPNEHSSCPKSTEHEAYRTCLIRVH